MCGIAGIFAYHPGAEPSDPDELGRICEAMASRGPDGSGLWLEEGRRVGLAHRRLAIIDVSETGAQPMADPNGRLTITFNGEIYNYRELRKDLEGRGYEFRSQSDTEVLLALWDLHGQEMVHHLRGMYAFALWDGGERSLFLARDPFGIKPLYVADDGRTLRFASQVKGLMAGGKVPAVTDLAAWAGFYMLGYVPEPHTVQRAVRAILPGQSILVRETGPAAPRFHFDLNAELRLAEETALQLPSIEAESRLRHALFDSVRAHLVADVPVGMFLSAGLDSSTVLGLATDAAPGTLHAITLGFNELRGSPQDETELATLAARHAGASHEVRWITRDDFAGHLKKLMKAMDQPSIDGINSYFVSLAAAQAGMKVALSGLGGDELMAGYPSFRQVPRLTRMLGPLALPAGLGRGFRRFFSPLLGRHVSPKYAGLLEYGGILPGAYLLRRALFMPWELPGLLGTLEGGQALEELDLMGRLQSSIEGLKSDRARMMALEMGWYLCGQLLKDTDWASMAHGLEVRVPMVDLELFRMLAPIQVGKAPLSKTALANCPSSGLIAALRHRPKTGFTTPVRYWAQELFGTPSRDRGLRGWALALSRPLIL